MNSYLNPSHEQRIGEILAARLPDVDVSLSSVVHPQVREYERTSTTVVNACLAPVVTHYLDRLEHQLERFGGDVHIMQSNGGIMSSTVARRRPIAMIESGPVAGALAAAKLARELALDQVVSFDMGGTTAKACLIRGGVPLERAGLEVSGAATAGSNDNSGGYAVTVPTVDLVEVGAGGGSIAWVAGGTLRVGPASAGADPGPVCYGRGGTSPTVTDANVVLGYLSSDAIADATIPIDRDAAFAALSALGDTLELDVMRTAYGIVQVANAVMMRALRAVSIERGYDPREFSLVAFGGAGPVHAAALAGTIGMQTVIVPPLPGVFSALGLMLADYRLDLVRSIAAPLDSIETGELLAAYADLEERAVADMARFGMSDGNVELVRRVDMKYAHQVEDLSVAFPSAEPTADLHARLRALFGEAHASEFGHVGDGRVSVVNLRLQAITRATDLSVADIGRRTLDDERGDGRAAHDEPAGLLRARERIRRHAGGASVGPRGRDRRAADRRGARHDGRGAAEVARQHRRQRQPGALAGLTAPAPGERRPLRPPGSSPPRRQGSGRRRRLTPNAGCSPSRRSPVTW